MTKAAGASVSTRAKEIKKAVAENVSFQRVVIFAHSVRSVVYYVLQGRQEDMVTIFISIQF